MPKGISINIGVNKVNPAYYRGVGYEPLTTCEADAKEMGRIATSGGGYEPPILLIKEDARIERVKTEIESAGRRIISAGGGLLFLSYSGHGAQKTDVSGDELSNDDQAFVLYNGLLLDDEIYALLGRFNASVKVFAIADCCHSGSIVAQTALPMDSNSVAIAKSLTARDANRAFLKNQRFSETFRFNNPPAAKIGTQILLISACQDNGFTLGGKMFSSFTSCLRKVWAEGAFQGDYREFYRQLKAPFIKPGSLGSQIPNYYTPPGSSREFEVLRPFSLS